MRPYSARFMFGSMFVVSLWAANAYGQDNSEDDTDPSFDPADSAAVAPIPTEEIDAIILDQLSQGEVFSWDSVSDVVVFSALLQSDQQLAIGYKPVNYQDSVAANIHQIDIQADDWVQARMDLYDIIADGLEASFGAPVSTDAFLLYEDDVLPFFIVSLDDFAVFQTLLADPTVRYAEPLSYAGNVYDHVFAPPVPLNSEGHSPTTAVLASTAGVICGPLGAAVGTSVGGAVGGLVGGVVGGSVGFVVGAVACIIAVLNDTYGCGGPALTPKSGDFDTVESTSIDPAATQFWAKASWNYKHHDIVQAWQQSAGENITIGVIDTGLDPRQTLLGAHFAKQLSANNLPIAMAAPRTISSKAPGVSTQSGVSTSGLGTVDTCGHGTKLAGLIAAPFQGAQTVGIAYKSNLVVFKGARDVLFDKADEKLAVTLSYKRLAEMNDVKIITMSMGDIFESKMIKEAILLADRNDKLIFNAVGSGVNYIGLDHVFPAGMNEVIAATGIKDLLNFKACSSCCKGKHVDFAVVMERDLHWWLPGTKSVTGPLTLAVTDFDLAETGGSSSASATMAGIAALVWAKDPAQTRQDVMDVLKNFASHGSQRDPEFGFGTVDAFDAVNSVSSPVVTPNCVNPPTGSSMTTPQPIVTSKHGISTNCASSEYWAGEALNQRICPPQPVGTNKYGGTARALSRYFSFVYDKGATMLTVEHVYSKGDLDAEILDGNGNSLYPEDSGNDNEVFLPHKFPSSMVDGETYYLRVYGWQGSANDFDVKLTTGLGISKLENPFFKSKNDPSVSVEHWLMEYETNIPARTLCYGVQLGMQDGGTCSYTTTNGTSYLGAFSEKDGTSLTTNHTCKYHPDQVPAPYNGADYLLGAYIPGVTSTIPKLTCQSQAPACFDRVR
jgi:hypothetical protein